jgi:adenosylmethionine-8-amino-7-oxononanoate aminotransferase
MAVGARSLFTEPFQDLLMTVDFLPFPETFFGDDQVLEKEKISLNLLQKKLEQHPQRYAALIVEPLVQGAGGMRMCRPEFMQQVVECCRASGTLVIFDEVMTGFGRTGDWFACLKSQVEPDIICLSKGLTGGFLPLSLTICSDKIYQAFYSDDPHKTLYHGHSFTANPLGCAAALASWELLQQAEPKFRSLEAIHHQHLQHFAHHPKVKNYRVTGTIAALELNQEDRGYLTKVSTYIRKKSLEKGVLFRPLGNVVYLLPPYCITLEELQWVYEKLGEILEELDLRT